MNLGEQVLMKDCLRENIENTEAGFLFYKIIALKCDLLRLLSFFFWGGGVLLLVSSKSWSFYKIANERCIYRSAFEVTLN